MIEINYRDSRPIYEQIKDGLRKLLIVGAIKEDEKLPSVRDMASQLSINPNTIQRAYRELEEEGFVYSVAGKGSFGSGKKGIDSKRRLELEKAIDEAVHELKLMGVDKEDIVNKIFAAYDK